MGAAPREESDSKTSCRGQAVAVAELEAAAATRVTKHGEGGSGRATTKAREKYEKARCHSSYANDAANGSG